MKKIIFITDNIFTERDKKRFGIEILKTKYLVEIFSFGKFQKQNLTNIKYFKDYNSFKKFLLKTKAYAVIDLLFPSLNSFLIKKLIKKKNIKLIKLNLGTSPMPNISFIKKLINKFYEKKQKGGSIIQKLKNHFFIKLNSLYEPDYLFISSRKEKINNFKGSVIKNHSLDYDIFLSNKKKIKENKVIFLDSNFLYNTDYKIHKTKKPITKDIYCKEINIFFDNLEKQLNKKIIIAASPKSNIKKISKIFDKREVAINKTFDLIRESSLVIVHKSTAISFAILFKKPMIFITTNQINESWLGDEINHIAKLLSCKTINISKISYLEKIFLPKINTSKYKRYINDFIKYPGSKKINNFKLFLKSI